MNAKAQIRQQMLRRREQMDETEYQQRCKAIHRCVVSHPTFRRAAWIHTYCSFNREVDTWRIIRSAFAMGKRVMVPVVQQSELRHIEIFPDQSFQPDAFGIPVPQFDHPPQWLDAAAILQPSDLVLVPLLAFDPDLYRLGYGKGYYDRFLARVRAVKMGIAFAFQRRESPLPRESHDVPLDLVVTDQAVYTRQQEHPCIGDPF